MRLLQKLILGCAAIAVLARATPVRPTIITTITITITTTGNGCGLLI